MSWGFVETDQSCVSSTPHPDCVWFAVNACWHLKMNLKWLLLPSSSRYLPLWCMMKDTCLNALINGHFEKWINLSISNLSLSLSLPFRLSFRHVVFDAVHLKGKEEKIQLFRDQRKAYVLFPFCTFIFFLFFSIALGSFLGFPWIFEGKGEKRVRENQSILSSSLSLCSSLPLFSSVERRRSEWADDSWTSFPCSLLTVDESVEWWRTHSPFNFSSRTSSSPSLFLHSLFSSPNLPFLLFLQQE